MKSCVAPANSFPFTVAAPAAHSRTFVVPDADPASAVTFTRLDSLASNDPNRYVTSIFADPANAKVQELLRGRSQP